MIIAARNDNLDGITITSLFLLANWAMYVTTTIKLLDSQRCLLAPAQQEESGGALLRQQEGFVHLAPWHLGGNARTPVFTSRIRTPRPRILKQRMLTDSTIRGDY
jgi:hypothetical protein